MPYPRRNCTETIDAFGNHLLTCHHGLSPGNSPLHWRHDSLVATLAGFLNRGRRNASTKPHPLEGERIHTDIKADGTRGGHDYLDVSIH